MSDIKIIIPPCITSKARFNFGQSINFIYADTLARFHLIKGDNVEFSPFSWNNHARRTENFFPESKKYDLLLKDSESLHKSIESTLEKIGITSSSSRYLDTNHFEQDKVREGLKELDRLGFIIHKGGELMLDLPKITRKTRIIEYLEDTAFMPEQIRPSIINIIKNSNPFLITQKCTFATEIPLELTNQTLENRRVKPVFNLYFSSRVLSDSPATYLVNGRSSTTRFVYNGFAIHSALYDSPLAKRVYTYPHIREPKGNWNIDDLFDELNNGDIIRYAALQYVTRHQDTILDSRLFLKGKKLINKITNLQRFFQRNPIHSPEPLDYAVLDSLSKGYVRDSLNLYEQKIFDLSKEVDILKRTPNPEINLPHYAKVFSRLYQTGKIFFTNL